MAGINAWNGQAFNWKAMSGSQKKDLFQAWRDKAEELKKAERTKGSDEVVSTSEPAKTTTKVVEVKPVETTQTVAPKVVETVVEAVAPVVEKQPEVVEAAAKPQKSAASDSASTDAKVAALTEALTQAGPEVVAQAAKLVEGVRSLMQRDDGGATAVSSDAAQRFPSYDRQEDAGKVNAEDYARRVAIAAQDRAAKMDILESVSLDSFAPMSRGAGAYGQAGQSGQPHVAEVPIDLSI